MKMRFSILSFAYNEGLSGFTVVDKHHRSPDWYIAKRGTHEGINYSAEQQMAAALRFAEHIWSLDAGGANNRREEDLIKIRALLDGLEPVFLTVPSTSGLNLAATGFARHFREKLNVNGEILDGRDYAMYAKPPGSDISQMKDVNRKRRSFMIRRYGFLPEKAEQLRVCC